MLFIVALIWGTTANAQFETGSKVINFGIGLGDYNIFSDGYSTKIPPIELSGEYFIMENISAGLFIGGSKNEYEYETSFGDTDVMTFSYFNVGTIGNYHFVNQEKFNVYAGVHLGYASVKVDFDEDDEDIYDALDTGSGLLAGVQVGGRYFFTKSLAANAELGYGVAVLKIGASFKF